MAPCGKKAVAVSCIWREPEYFATWMRCYLCASGRLKRRVEAKSLAVITSAKFRFYGRAGARSRGADVGRSALDGLMVMPIAVELLREHVAGGDAHSLRC